jgi:glycosyltransferase involved in cell wall biosynthesis/SAM-dependent methyltransferase
MSPLTATVVVPTRGRPLLLDRCLTALAAQHLQPLEVIVVDSAPVDEAARIVAGRHGAAYVVEPEPGASAARNRGARAARGDVVAFVDDDAVAEPGWLASLLAEFADPLVAAANGRTLAIGASTDDERRFAELAGADSRGPSRRVVDRDDPHWFELVNFGGLGDEMNMALRRSVFSEWPGFDERLGPGASRLQSEGHYAVFQLVERGFKAVYAPEAVVSHPYPLTADDTRRRNYRDLALATAYSAFLFVEEPRYRRRLVRYTLQAVRGKERPWRSELARSGRSILPRRRLPSAFARGIGLYLRSRLSRVGPLRSTWHLGLAVAHAAGNDRHRVRNMLEATFRGSPDPWGYRSELGAKRLEREIAMIDQARGGSVFERAIEIGCAEGDFTRLLASRCRTLLAVDISPTALDRARANCTADNVTFAQWDLRSDPLSGDFDLIVVVSVLEYMARPWSIRRARRKLVAALRPGGLLVLGNVRGFRLLEQAWWSRPLLQGGKNVERFFAGHPLLEVVDRGEDDDFTEILLRRAVP